MNLNVATLYPIDEYKACQQPNICPFCYSGPPSRSWGSGRKRNRVHGSIHACQGIV